MDQNEISEDVLVVKESSVHGEGLFTTIALKPNDVIPLENNTIKLIDIKQEMSKDVHKKFLDLMTENPNEEFLDAWFLIFHILSLESIPEWFGKLHRNTSLREQMGLLDRTLLKKCFEVYSNESMNKNVMHIFDITVTNFLVGRQKPYYYISEGSSKLNHNENNNVLTFIDYETLQLKLKVICDIEAGNELFIRYPDHYSRKI